MPAVADLDGAEEVLVPGEPVAAMICAYPGGNASPGGEALAGSRSLTSGVVAMAHDLSYLPAAVSFRGGPCTLVGGRMTNYLIRFAYSDGQALWVGSAEEVNRCVTTTNGAIGSRSYIGPSLTAAYRSGTWRLTRPSDPCQVRLGRRGQDEQMVPGNPTTVVICRLGSSSGPPPRVEHDATTAYSLAALLNSVDTRPSEHMCQNIAGTDDSKFHLLFHYADGPLANVTILTGCTPAIDNELLQAELDSRIHELLTRLGPSAAPSAPRR